MSLDHKIKQTISLGAPAISRQGFGTVLVLGDATFTPRVKFFGPDDDYAEDAELSSTLQDALTTAFLQSPQPTRVAVGRRDNDVAQVVEFKFDGHEDGDYVITINNTDHTYTASTDSLSTIVDGLSTLVDADLNVSATDDSTDTVTVTASVPGVGFSFSASVPGASTVAETVDVENAGLTAALQKCLAQSSEWFGFCIETRTENDILAAAEWAEGHGRLFFAQSSDADILTSSTSDIASQFEDLSYQMTAVAYYSDDADYFDVGWMVGFLGHSFDQTAPTAVYNTVKGIAPDLSDSTGQLNAEAKNANYYSTLKGIGATFGGTVADGRDIEHVVTGEWVKARLSEGVATLFLGASERGERVPFSDQGIAMLEQVTFDVLLLGERLGHFNPGTSEVDMPRRADISPGDLQQGLLRYQWGTQYSGTIKEVTIQGYVSLDFEGFESA